VATVEGSVLAATPWMASTASPSAKPSARLKPMVTDGSWPLWLTMLGPVFVVTFASVLNGISRDGANAFNPPVALT
jgi:hypothetical protein